MATGWRCVTQREKIFRKKKKLPTREEQKRKGGLAGVGLCRGRKRAQIGLPHPGGDDQQGPRKDFAQE